MNKITVEWSGLQQLINDVSNNLPKDVAKEVQKAQEEDLRDVASFLSNYPPEKPGQKYIRTGNLGLGWLTAQPKVRILGGLNFMVSIKNRMRYAEAVQGGQDNNPRQDPEFKERGWDSVDDALKATESRAKKRIDEAVQKAVDNRLGKYR